MADETISKKEYDAVVLQLDSEKKKVTELNQELATTKAEILQKNEQIKGFEEAAKKAEIEAKTSKFLAQFPEVNREKAKTELLPLLLEKPEELVLNAAKMAELMKVPEEPKAESQGKEFVQTNAQDDGIPTPDYVKKQMGIA